MDKFTDAFGRTITDGAKCMFSGEFPKNMPAEKRIRHGIAKIIDGQLKFCVLIGGRWWTSGLYWDYDGENCHDLMLAK